MEYEQDQGPVESADVGDAYGAEPAEPPWLAGVQENFNTQLERSRRDRPDPEPFEEEYELAPGPEAYGDELGPDGDDLSGGDDFDLEAFASEFAPEDEAADMFDPEPHPAEARVAQLEQERFEAGLEGLAEEFPAIDHPDHAEPLAELVIGAAREFGAELTPGFVRTIFLASMAEQMAARERPARDNPNEAVLEMGGVADPGEPAEENEFLQMAREGRNDPNRLQWKD